MASPRPPPLHLVESGVPNSELHGTANRYATPEVASLLLPPSNRALAALVTDLIDHGVYDRTLIIVMGEFGRTPRMNSAAGRDHWGDVFSVLIRRNLKVAQACSQSSPWGCACFFSVVMRP